MVRWLRNLGLILVAAPVAGFMVLVVATGDPVQSLISKIIIYPAYWAYSNGLLLWVAGLLCLIASFLAGRWQKEPRT